MTNQKYPLTNPSAISSCPAFNARLDDTDAMTCSGSAFAELAAEAPDPHSQGWLAGIHAFRVQLSALTGLAAFT